MNEMSPPMVCDPVILGSADDRGAQARVLGRIAELNLEKNAWEIDTFGYTVLTPQQVAPASFCEKLRDHILDEAARASGTRPALNSGTEPGEYLTFLGRTQFLPDMLFADRAFEQAVMNEKILALVTYMLGESCLMTAMNGVVKGPGPEYMPYHVDTPEPSPLPPYSTVANVTWLLSDFDKPNGGTFFLPGSNRWCRAPMHAESVDLSAAVTPQAPAGSVLIWNGNVWHGAWPRTAPGVRVSMITYFARYYMRDQRDDALGHYSERVTAEMLARNPERFAVLTGKKRGDVSDEQHRRTSLFA
jgi:hypothetical protein